MEFPVTRHTPHFSRQLHVGCPNIGDREQLRARIEDILDRRWLTNHGPYVQAFEERLCNYLGAKHCIAVCNATVGLEIAIRGLGLVGEVIVPSFTFPATAHALAWQGMTPVFCDVDPETHNIDPEQVERLITPRTTGILGVHVWGNACDADALADIAARKGLRLLFDAAHALGCGHDGQMIGNFGDAEVFSFHATKFVNSGEGGAIVTNDDELAETLRRLRSFGLENGDVVEVGVNGKMNELTAAMGLTSLESCATFIDRNRSNYLAYQSALAGVQGLKLFTPRTTVHNYQYVVVEVDQRQAGLSRDQLVELLHANNVLAKKYFSPGCHRMEPYRRLSDVASHPLPHTERLCGRLLQLPTGSAIDADDIRQIGELLHGMTSRIRRAA
jgi:dTDP-4-amino-4,6-dideoxygalactose transaminase